MASLKDEVKRTSGKSRIFVYEEDLRYLDPDNFEEELEKILDYSRDAFLIASNRLTELGLSLVDSPTDQNNRSIEKTQDLEDGRKVVPFSVSLDLYTKIQERRGEIWDADFLNIAINHHRDMRRLHERYTGRRETIRVKRTSETEDDLYDEEDQEELEEDSEDEKVEVRFLGMDVDFDKTSKILWVLGLALFGIGDTATTYWSLMKGNIETNPILAFLLGLNPLVMISFKIAIICAFYVMFAVLKNKHGKDSYLLWIPTIMIILGGYLTINNYLVIMRT